MIVLAELYDVLIEAGASEEKARAAARAVVDLCRRPVWSGENLLPSIEPRFNVV